MLITATILFILSSSITSRRDQSIFYNRFLLVILTNAIILAYLNIIFNIKGVGLYNNLFTYNSINIIFNIFIFILTLVILSMSSFYPRKVLFKNKGKLNMLLVNKSVEQFKIIEYPLIILFVIIGAVFLMNSNDIVSIFISVELQSYGLYLLCTLFRNSELSTSSGLTYFLLGSLSSCFILLGAGLLYINTGITNLEYIYIINNISYTIYNTDYINTNYCLLIMSIGFLFKISAAPFHFWSPDVYDGIPTITTTFIAIVTKISIFIFMLELVNYCENTLNTDWTIGILFSSLLSLIIGTVLGLNQSRIKRLFAYSTISHIGFLLLALGINSLESNQAFIFYIIQYSLSNLNIFIILITIGYILYNYTSDSIENKKLQDKNNSPIQFINQLKGLFRINPLISITLAITIYSLIGIPPLIGFFGKQAILSSSLDENYVFITLIAILCSVISAVYYLNIVKNMFFEEQKFKKILNKKIKLKVLYKINKLNNYTYLSSVLTLPISLLTSIIMMFIIGPDELLNITILLPSILYS